MKFSDYKTHFLQHRAAEEAVYAQVRPLNDEYHKLTEALSRRYELGYTEPGQHRTSELVTAEVQTYGGAPTLALRGMHSYALPDLCVLTAAQLTKLAEIRRMVEEWVLGEIDEMPPSGIWDDVANYRMKEVVDKIVAATKPS